MIWFQDYQHPKDLWYRIKFQRVYRWKLKAFLTDGGRDVANVLTLNKE